VAFEGSNLLQCQCWRSVQCRKTLQSRFADNFLILQETW
jgi:hypothetical protein